MGVHFEIGPDDGDEISAEMKGLEDLRRKNEVDTRRPNERYGDLHT